MGGLVAQLRAFGTLRLAAMALVAVAMFGLLGWLGLRANQPTMALLYGEMEPRDAGAVVASLERQRIPHRIMGGGTQILVPEDQIARLRLSLAREGLPNGGATGYEIFDRGESLTTTPFQQDVNRLRALEGELVRSIRTLHGVRAARVHLVLPRREAFTRERGDAQASIVLTMQGAQRLDREGVQAVLHLVATAVPGLRAQNVSIVDSRGELLARGGQALAGPATAQTQDEMKRAQEMRLARSVEDMLERTLGAGRVRAEASVELDFDRVQTTEERFDPDNQVPRSTSSTTQAQRGGEAPAATVQNNLPGAEAGGGSQTSENRAEETTNFEIGRTTRSTLREAPSLRRLSIAVLVDGVWDPAEGSAPLSFRDRSAEELARIASLVRSAVGFNEQRGDRVEVVSLRFADPPLRAVETETGMLGLPITPAMVWRLGESLVFALVALLAVLLIGRPMARRLALGFAPPAPMALPQGAAPPALAGPADAAALHAQPGQKALSGHDGEATTVALRNVEGPVRASALVTLHEMVEKHPAESLAVIRNWMEQPSE
ncbi:flagellar basal-body MS-ring/collar protein FliF [Plastoroseomonas arctica]|uniref:Flagellar M-ring protein n=1 Tax=Plastoroseomonas arctica TaxID=1509237 RepID=A0AAF1JZ07_9PROT|nr:flagellar basal-body MS-ring/collar protein FliF [Plastoroseomonas arctica]MBR0657379.1 flagellar M-ring protein FliF [Plastoroseomonas arctica]